MRCALGEAAPDELLERRSRSRTSTTSAARRARAGAPPLAAARRHAGAVHASARAPASPSLDFGCKRSIVRAARRRGARGRGRARRSADADAILALDPAAVLVGNGPGDPAQLTDAGRDGARAARPRAALRRLPRPPAARARARAADVQAAVRPPRREPPRARRGTRAACSSPSRTTASPSRRRTRAEVSHVSLNDGTVEGLEGDGLLHAPVPPRGRARAPRRPSLLRPDRGGVPKRTDLRSILIVGSGPIRIGQACEFDYSGAQACRVLRAEGYRVVLVNSNPATIMTDPEWADATYLEPLDAEARRRRSSSASARTRCCRRSAARRRSTSPSSSPRPASLDRVRGRADRRRPRRHPPGRGPLRVPRRRWRPPGSGAGQRRRALASTSWTAGRAPAVVRPAFTLGGQGGGLARTPRSCARASTPGSRASPIGQVLVERSLEGWQEFELEVMVDAAGNCVVVCSIENLDPMGVHTGDSWTVAPQQTLPDAEYQRLREAAFACARTVGVATGGANVQFAYEPETPRAGADRDEPARLALLGARIEGDRLPDREAGGAARGRLHARRAAERHHRARRAPRSSRRSTTSRSRRRASTSTSSPAPSRRSARRCGRSARRSGSGARSRRRS